MLSLTRRSGALVLAALLTSVGPLPAQDDTQGAVSPRPTLVVMLTVDQLRPDYLTLFDRQFTGGFARLLRGGAVFLNGFQDHANTETAPGHASTIRVESRSENNESRKTPRYRSRRTIWSWISRESGPKR